RREVPQDRSTCEPTRLDRPIPPRLLGAERQARPGEHQDWGDAGGHVRGDQESAAGERPDAARVRRAVQGCGAQRAVAGRCRASWRRLKLPDVLEGWYFL